MFQFPLIHSKKSPANCIVLKNNSEKGADFYNFASPLLNPFVYLSFHHLASHSLILKQTHNNKQRNTNIEKRKRNLYHNPINGKER